MARHNSRERQLFGDLNEKNRLAGEFRRLSSRVRDWRDRMGRKRGKRSQARYGQAIGKADERLQALRAELLERAEDLKARILEEKKISAAEVKKFEAQYKKEVEELRNAHEAMAESQEAMAEASAKSRGVEWNGGVLSGLRQRHRNAARNLRREKGEVKKAAQEIESEARDEVILDNELRRILGEVAALDE
jgi:hypothetical protein